MSRPILAICDTDTDYRNRLVTFFREKKDFPFEVQAFSGADKLSHFLEKQLPELILIHPNEYSDELRENAKCCVIILAEQTEEWQESAVNAVSKYQAAGELYRNIMEVYTESGGRFGTSMPMKKRSRYIGFYTPVHRSLQTTMALTVGQLLGEKDRTLYISFECFSGLEQMLGRPMGGNLSDLLYFYECDESKLAGRLESMVRKLGTLDILPPPVTHEDLMQIRPEVWKGFLESVSERGRYRYLVLDLSEQVQGLFEILENCDRIFTMVKEDRMSKAKLAQYELLLMELKRDAINRRTKRVALPMMQHLPADLERLCKCELTDYARLLLKEQEGE